MQIDTLSKPDEIKLLRLNSQQLGNTVHTTTLRQERKNFSLGRFVSALRHKPCIMRKGQRRNEDIYEIIFNKKRNQNQ